MIPRGPPVEHQLCADWLHSAILDLAACDEPGRRFNVESQVARQLGFAERSLFYWARSYTEGLENGIAYTELRPVVCIDILDFVYWTADSRAHTHFLPEEDMKILLSDETIRRAHEEFTRTATDPETRRLALAREKLKNDRANMMETGRVNGLEEGRAEARGGAYRFLAISRMESPSSISV